jgi:[protein-PII] uridylyltransferase
MLNAAEASLPDIAPLLRERLDGLRVSGGEDPRQAYLRALRAFLDEGIGAIRRLHEEERSRPGSGLLVVRRQTALLDALVKELYRLAREQHHALAPPEDGLAVLAIGGYGRGELNPQSDVDLLFVCPGAITPFAERVAETVLYYLWDLGFQVGHSVRSFADCIRMVRGDFIVRTSLLEGRFLAGDASVFQRFTEDLRRDLYAHADRFIKEKLANRERRHKTFGGSVFLREPQLKEGEGGLRDLQTACWIAKIKFKAETLDPLVRKGVLTPRDLERMSRVLDFFWRVRNEIHFRTGRKNDTLSFEIQEEVGAALGYTAGEGFTLLEQFMRDYYAHAREVRRLATRLINHSLVVPMRRRPAIDRFRQRRLDDLLILSGGDLFISDAQKPRLLEEPWRILELFRAAQQRSATVTGRTKDWILEQHEFPSARLETFRRDPRAAQAFLGILGGPHGIHAALAGLHEVGVLGQYLPEFGALTTLVQHNPYHKYTVDEHTLKAIRQVEDLRATTHPQKAFMGKVLREVRRPDLLFLAVLLHDIGKALGKDRLHQGVEMVPVVASRLGLGPEETQMLVFLVEHHILMPQLAFRRELNDPKLLRDFAAVVRDTERLRMLYLLSYADVSAVGPEVWTDWKGALLQDLYLRSLRYLEVGEAPYLEEEKEAVEEIRHRVLADLPPELDRAAAIRFLGEMPPKYFLVTALQRMRDHLSLVRRLDRERLLITHRHDAARGFTELTVCAYDAFGFFYRTCGAIAAKNMSILGAEIFTSAGGVVLDTYRVTDPKGKLLPDEDIWQSIEGSLREVLTGRKRVEALLSRRTPLDPQWRKQYAYIEDRVVFDNTGSDAHTIIEVFTSDRVGLLYRIAKTLYELGVNIDSAKITTEQHRVVDVFYVTDLLRHKITAEPKLRRIHDGLLAAVKAD